MWQMKTEVTPVVVGALGTVKKRMVENIKKVSERATVTETQKVRTNPQEGAYCMNRMTDLSDWCCRCMVYNNNTTTMIYLTTLSSKSTSARSKYDGALNLQL